MQKQAKSSHLLPIYLQVTSADFTNKNKLCFFSLTLGLAEVFQMGLPLELLPSLSKAETGSWINLSGTCPPKASLLGEPLGHSKDSKEDSSCLPLEWLIYFPLAFISHQREYPCRRSMRMSKLWIQNILKLPLLQDVYLETIVWVPHFSITIFYFKHTLKFKLGPRQC